MKEAEIKKILLQTLMRTQVDFTLASEVPFLFGSRRADIVLLDEEFATAFEIKSVSDSVERLDYQLQSYREYFDFCYVVCELENLQQVRFRCPKGIGILAIENNKIVRNIRKASIIRRHNKVALASTLPSQKLRKLLSDSDKKSKFELCKLLALSYTTDDIRNISRRDLLSRLKPSFELFKRDIGENVDSDDIRTLTIAPPQSLNLISKD